MYLYILFNGQDGQYTIFDVLFVVYLENTLEEVNDGLAINLRNSFLISIWAFILGLLLGKCIIPLY